MRSLIMALLLLPGWAYAQSPSCAMQSTTKNLHGAAETSFMTKCRSDTVARCTSEADGKKLAGAARNSFTQKCVKDGVGG